MDKQQIIDEFFRGFRVSLTNAFSYSKDHPYFIKSVENLKTKLQEIPVILNPLKIGVTSSGLMVDGMNLTQTFYSELARLLHQRKIKSIKIDSGATLKELVSFLSVISMAQKDILKNGGVKVLLEKKQLANLSIEELDYSEFLYGEDQECADVWSHLLKDITQADDQVKINNLVGNFEKLIKRTNQDDFFKTLEMPAMINEFLICLKSKDKDKFSKCSKDIFLWLLHNRQSINEEKLTKMNQVFDSLSQEDFSNLLWEGLSEEDNFDSLSLQFFSKITEQRNPVQIAQGVINKANAAGNLNGNPRVVKRIQNLLTGAGDDRLSLVYRNTLESLIKGISSSGRLFFDQKALKENYRYIVLNMLSLEDDQDKDNLERAAEVLEKELESTIQDNDLGFLKDLWGLLVERKKQGNSVCTAFQEKFSIFIENFILGQPLSPEQECLAQMVSSPSQEMNFYLDKIFIAEQANKQAVGLFFRFFPGSIDIFYQKVKPKLQDIEFLSSLIEVLGQLDLPVSLEILEHLYFSTSELMKAEILNTMRKLKKEDVRFLMSQLDTDSFSLRKNLLSILTMNTQAGQEALDALLRIPNFFGRKNKLLIENMQIIFELGLIQAAGRIHDLSRRRFFWNWELRAKAKHILKEWNV